MEKQKESEQYLKTLKWVTCKSAKRGILKGGTVRVKIITGSLVTLENLFPENYRYRYRLEIRTNYHYRYRLGPRSRPFISIDSQLPSRKSFELIFAKNYRYGYRLEMFLN